MGRPVNDIKTKLRELYDGFRGTDSCDMLLIYQIKWGNNELDIHKWSMLRVSFTNRKLFMTWTCNYTRIIY